jgi:hypothetical protein
LSVGARDQDYGYDGSDAINKAKSFFRAAFGWAAIRWIGGTFIKLVNIINDIYDITNITSTVIIGITFGHTLRRATVRRTAVTFTKLINIINDIYSITNVTDTIIVGITWDVTATALKILPKSIMQDKTSVSAFSRSYLPDSGTELEVGRLTIV